MSYLIKPIYIILDVFLDVDHENHEKFEKIEYKGD